MGSLLVPGEYVRGGKRVPGLSNVWMDDAQQYVYTLVNGGRDLVVGKRSAPGSSVVVGRF